MNLLTLPPCCALVRRAEQFLSMRTAFPLGETNPARAPQDHVAPADHCQVVCGTSLGLDTPSPERHLEADVGVMQMFGPYNHCFILPTCAELLAYLDIATSCSMKHLCACSACALLVRGTGLPLRLSWQRPHWALSIICINKNSSGRLGLLQG